uniref:Uncharacterized protein n=1 Tax=Hippocampus comes TaxID=109280 RepID=A0A3Q2YMJ7_HIPCM
RGEPVGALGISIQPKYKCSNPEESQQCLLFSVSPPLCCNTLQKIPLLFFPHYPHQMLPTSSPIMSWEASQSETPVCIGNFTFVLLFGKGGT